MNVKSLLIPAFILFLGSCKKSDTTPNVPPAEDKYQAISAGSTWNYHEVDSSGLAPVNSDYSLTSASRDTAISGKSYHIFNNSDGSLQYFNISGNDYYQFDSLPAALGTAVFERLYLKDNAAVGTTWSQNLSVTLPGVPLPVPVTLTYTIAEKGISRSVNGTNYTDVIHVTTSISSLLIPSTALTTDINGYYARKYGLIEASNIVHLDFTGIVQDIKINTKLVSATIL